MSGIFGVLDPKRQAHQQGLLGLMGKAMAHRDWYAVETYEDALEGVGLGRIGIGIFNRAPQPVWNEAHTIALVMAGELYGPEVAASGDPLQSDEQRVLSLYERVREDFVSELKGVFIIAVWDKPRKRLLIANDRFGLYPLFYTYRAGRLVFAPEMKGCLCDADLPRQLDLTALAQTMRFQLVLGERTFFEGIALLPPASVLSYDLERAECRIGRYWDIDRIPCHPQITLAEAVVRFPLFDYDFFDFVYSAPSRLRDNLALYRGIIQREVPRLAYIPYEYDELLPTTHRWVRKAHALAMKVKRRAKRHLLPFLPELHTLYADYENYLRSDLREWGESILFDKRTLERGIFSPAFLRSIWARHQSGQEMHTIGKIAPIITYEMMLRRLHD